MTLGYDVERTNKDRWADIAAHVGMSPSALFDRMVENIELDGRGYPTWLPEQPLKDGELPIDPA
ncbi:hypothetical protein [Agromyces humatus]|uniref:hypothetical protein n=1 Tax=Agromyces humatus TaxID=279573 RepID=UPI0031D8DCD3